MSLTFSYQLLLIFHLVVLGAFGQIWKVEYRHNAMCALKGSTVFINSFYKHPSGFTTIDKFWVKNPVKDQEPTDLKKVPDFSGRVEYLESQRHNFSFILSNVTKRDKGMYCLEITTNIQAERYLGYPGVILNVTDLRVEIPEQVLEGNATLLKCVTSCNLTDRSTFIWYKNGKRIGTHNQETNTLYLQPTRIDDTGSYRCAVGGYEHLSSPAVSLNVRYSPKNVSVSISPSGVIVEGGSVTLTCSSDGNPPVENYTWFKAKSLVGKGTPYTISKLSFEDSGEYKCKSSNDEGVQYSASVTLTVIGRLSKVHQAVIGIIISCAVLSFTVAIFLLWRKKKGCWSSKEEPLKQDNTYSNIGTPAKNAPQSKIGSVNQDDSQYASIVHRSADGTAVRAYAASAAGEGQYAMVQHHCEKPMKKTQEEDVQYASVTFHQSHRPAEMVKNNSVIYSTVK